MLSLSKRFVESKISRIFILDEIAIDPFVNILYLSNIYDDFWSLDEDFLISVVGSAGSILVSSFLTLKEGEIFEI